MGNVRQRARECYIDTLIQHPKLDQKRPKTHVLGLWEEKNCCINLWKEENYFSVALDTVIKLASSSSHILHNVPVSHKVHANFASEITEIHALR